MVSDKLMKREDSEDGEERGQEGMNARELLITKLKEIGADGLCNTYVECGCALDDLEPCCGCELSVCEPAKKREDGMFYSMEGGKKK